MNYQEKLNKIKEVLGLEPKVEEVEVKDEVVLAEEPAVEEPKQEVSEEAKPSYVTEQQLSEVKRQFEDFKSEVVSMLSLLVEETKKDTKEVPQELAKEEPKKEVELAEEIVHSPEVEVEKEAVKFSKPFGAMSIQERIGQLLNK